MLGAILLVHKVSIVCCYKLKYLNVHLIKYVATEIIGKYIEHCHTISTKKDISVWR